MSTPPRLIQRLAIIVLLALAMASCSRDKAPNIFWDTADRATDSILSLVDSLENPEAYGRDVNDVDYDRLRELYLLVDSLQSRRSGSTAEAISFFARAAIAEESELDDAKAYRLDSMAVALADSAASPYAYSRICFDKARLSPDIKAETGRLYSSVAYFRSIGDSIYLTESLFELQNAYADIWDDATTMQCYRDIIRFSPAANSQLRSYMRFNIMMAARTTDTAFYHRSLDSLRLDKALFDNAPVIGVTVYSDLYRLSGDGACLDTAEHYLPPIRFYHECKRLYAAQRLAQGMAEGKDPEALAPYADVLAPGLDDPGTIEIETLPVLRDYLLGSGETELAARADSVYGRLKVRSAAYKEATRMTRMNMERRLDEALAEAGGSRSLSMAGWCAIVLAVVLLVAVGYAAVKRSAARRRSTEERLGRELEKARRQAAVTHLQEVERVGGEDDWERFEAVFVEMHPDFPASLKAACPGLTKGDIRMCALLRMGMDTKHIARILGINPESVKKHRQRLRAKFGLAQGVDWQEFLSGY